MAHPTKSIERIRVGECVLGENPDFAKWQHRTHTSVDPTTWRLLKLHAEQRWDDGTLDTIEVETLQPREWLEKHRARRGMFVPLPIDLTEMGFPADMRAKVAAVEPCPQIADGPGHVVTSTVSHLNRFLFDLEIVNGAGRTEKITTTGYHKFYSATQRGWVSACDLTRGELLCGVEGALAVAAINRLPGVERVYNFSVEGEHVYQVSALGALVHNPDCFHGTNDAGAQNIANNGVQPMGEDDAFFMTTNQAEAQKIAQDVAGAQGGNPAVVQLQMEKNWFDDQWLAGNINRPLAGGGVAPWMQVPPAGMGPFNAGIQNGNIVVNILPFPW